MCKRVTVRTVSSEGDPNVDVNSTIQEYCTPTLEPNWRPCIGGSRSP